MGEAYATILHLAHRGVKLGFAKQDFFKRQ